MKTRVPGKQHPTVVKALLHTRGNGFNEEVKLDELDQLLAAADNFVWLDIQNPGEKEVALLEREFGFHPLVLEDVVRLRQRPKLEEYGNFYFLVFYSVSWNKDGMVPREIHLFVGSNYLVTVHGEPVREIEEGLERWKRDDPSLGHGVGTLLYSLLDSLVDGYFVVADEVADRATRMEERVLSGTDQHGMRTIFQLKKQLLSFRRLLGPERDAINTLMRQGLPFFDDRTILYLRDVYDHIVRVTDTVDLYEDILTSTTDVHLSAASNRLNLIMKTLTSWTIILMSLAVVAGIYGMNFRNMPELEWRLGYPFALGLMLAIGVGLFIHFRRRDWL